MHGRSTLSCWTTSVYETAALRSQAKRVHAAKPGVCPASPLGSTDDFMLEAKLTGLLWQAEARGGGEAAHLRDRPLAGGRHGAHVCRGPHAPQQRRAPIRKLPNKPAFLCMPCASTTSGQALSTHLVCLAGITAICTAHTTLGVHCTVSQVVLNALLKIKPMNHTIL